MADRGKQFRAHCRFELGGKTYEYHGYLSAADALLIRQHAGMGALEWKVALGVGDSAALIALVLITLRQTGERVTWDEVVERIDGDDDIWAVFDSLEQIPGDDETPATEVAVDGPAEEAVAVEPAV